MVEGGTSSRALTKTRFFFSASTALYPFLCIIMISLHSIKPLPHYRCNTELDFQVLYIEIFFSLHTLLFGIIIVRKALFFFFYFILLFFVVVIFFSSIERVFCASRWGDSNWWQMEYSCGKYMFTCV